MRVNGPPGLDDRQTSKPLVSAPRVCAHSRRIEVVDPKLVPFSAASGRDDVEELHLDRSEMVGEREPEQHRPRITVRSQRELEPIAEHRGVGVDGPEARGPVDHRNQGMRLLVRLLERGESPQDRGRPVLPGVLQGHPVVDGLSGLDGPVAIPAWREVIHRMRVVLEVGPADRHHEPVLPGPLGGGDVHGEDRLIGHRRRVWRW